MAKYKEKKTIGESTSWTRSNGFYFEDTYGQTPKFVFSEEIRTELPDGQVMTVPAGRITEDFNPTSKIDLIDLNTGDDLGQTMTYQELRVALNSFHIQLGKARDIEEAKG